MNNEDIRLTEEEYREVIKYGRSMLFTIIIGMMVAIGIGIYMKMLKKE